MYHGQDHRHFDIFKHTEAKWRIMASHNSVILGSNNGSVLGGRQAITWFNVDLSFIWT